MITYQESNAYLSKCLKYRYFLRRIWDNTKIRVLFVMLNPSTADALIDDRTIQSCVRLCDALGFGGFEVVNLFAYRATDPEELFECDDPIGEENDNFIASAIGRCDLTICAWGSHKSVEKRRMRVLEMALRRRPAVFCFAKNKDGNPKHPLYVKAGSSLYVYRST